MWDGVVCMEYGGGGHPLRQVFKAPETQGPFSFKAPHSAGFHGVMTVLASSKFCDISQYSLPVSTGLSDG